MNKHNELLQVALDYEALGIDAPRSEAEQDAVNAYHAERHWDAYLARLAKYEAKQEGEALARLERWERAARMVA
jgi:hypothetical protein